MAAAWARTTAAARAGSPAILVRLVRVHADRKPDLRPQRAEPLRLRRFLRVPRFKDHQDALEPAVLRAADDLV